MLILMTLHGSISGSAAVRTTGESTSFELRARRRDGIVSHMNGLTVFLISNERICAAEPGLLRGTAKIGNVRGIVLADRNGAVAFGSNGLSRQRMQHALEVVALGRLGKTIPEQAPNDAGNDSFGQKAEAPSTDHIYTAGSEAGRRILKAAHELFSPASTLDPPERGAAETQWSYPVRIENPFPTLFGRSACFVRIDRNELTGRTVIRGKEYEITASRSRRGNVSGCGGRPFRARAADGTVYWVAVKENRRN